jgi:serine protease Do
MWPLLLAVMAWGAEEPVEANALFKKVSPAILTVRVGFDESSPKRSYGTGFALYNNGIVATNFHVIEEAVFNPNTYKIFVEREGFVAKASVLRIDPVNDLALLDTAFKPEIVPELSEETLAKGDKVFAMGIPKDLGVGIAEGNFGGEIQFGPYRELVLSLPFNNGMTGGPVLNAKGKVVGVNLARVRDAQNISFAIPSALLNRLRQSPPNLELAPHLRATQDSFLSLLRAQAEKISHTEYRSQAPLKGLNCWRDKNSLANLKRLDSQSCQTRFSFSVEGASLGFVEMWHIELENREKEELAAYKHLDYAFNREFAFLARYKKDTQRTRVFTEHDCVDGNVTNSSGVPLKSSVCMAAYKKYEGFYDALVRVMTIDPKSKRPLLVALRLAGFGKDAVKEMSGRLLESIEHL